MSNHFFSAVLFQAVLSESRQVAFLSRRNPQLNRDDDGEKHTSEKKTIAGKQKRNENENHEKRLELSAGIRAMLWRKREADAL